MNIVFSSKNLDILFVIIAERVCTISSLTSKEGFR